jgi:hypothetical protein
MGRAFAPLWAAIGHFRSALAAAGLISLKCAPGFAIRRFCCYIYWEYLLQ